MTPNDRINAEAQFEIMVTAGFGNIFHIIMYLLWKGNMKTLKAKYAEGVKQIINDGKVIEVLTKIAEALRDLAELHEEKGYWKEKSLLNIQYKQMLEFKNNIENNFLSTFVGSKGFIRIQKIFSMRQNVAHLKKVIPPINCTKFQSNWILAIVNSDMLFDASMQTTADVHMLGIIKKVKPKDITSHIKRENSTPRRESGRKKKEKKQQKKQKRKPEKTLSQWTEHNGDSENAKRKLKEYHKVNGKLKMKQNALKKLTRNKICGFWAAKYGQECGFSNNLDCPRHHVCLQCGAVNLHDIDDCPVNYAMELDSAANDDNNV